MPPIPGHEPDSDGWYRCDGCGQAFDGDDLDEDSLCATCATERIFG